MRPERAPRRQANRSNRPEQLIDTSFPGQQFPVGSVVKFLDRHQRTAFPAVTELRRATKASSPTTRPADGACVSCAGLRLIKASPTGGATMQQVELSVDFVLRATRSDIQDTLPHDIAHAVVGPGHGHDVMCIDPTATGTVKRPSADLRRSPPAGGSFGPPSRPIDDTTRRSLEQPPENSSVPAHTTTRRATATSGHHRGANCFSRRRPAPDGENPTAAAWSLAAGRRAPGPCAAQRELRPGA